MTSGLSTADYLTGHALYDGEWLFGTYQMAALGFGQTALEHPALRERHAGLMAVCLERMLSPEVRAHDRTRWGEDPLEGLDEGGDHAAYLGYLNLALGLHRLLAPASPLSDWHERVSAALARRLERSLLMETYPGEAYPVDMAAVVGSLGLHMLAAGADHRALIERWSARCRAEWLEPRTGLLHQAVDPVSGAPRDAPRGSGTALAAYFLSFGAPELAADLFLAMRRYMQSAPLGFGMAREYPPGGPAGPGDIDSGPVLFGHGVSATGFSLAASRIHGDRELFGRLLASVHLFGAPLEQDGALEFVTGGPIGNALLFALLTARPLGRPSAGRAP